MFGENKLRVLVNFIMFCLNLEKVSLWRAHLVIEALLFDGWKYKKQTDYDVCFQFM